VALFFPGQTFWHKLQSIVGYECVLFKHIPDSSLNVSQV